jgi:hypothetical protein
MSANAFMFNSCYNLPERDIGFVIGTKGNKLQAIQRETGASIKLVKAPAGSGMQPYFHITSFSMDTVNAAWAKLHEVATLAMQLNTGAIERKNQERFPEFFLRVEPIFCGHIIGYKGSHIRRVHREMGTRILSVVDHKGGKAIRIVAKTDKLINDVCRYYRTNFPRFAFMEYNERWTPCEARTAQIEAAFQVYLQDLKEGKSGATLTHATWHATLPDTEDYMPPKSPAYSPRLAANLKVAYDCVPTSPTFSPYKRVPRTPPVMPSDDEPSMPTRELTISNDHPEYNEDLDSSN